MHLFPLLLISPAFLLVPNAATQCGLGTSGPGDPLEAFGSALDAEGDWVAVGAPEGGPITAGTAYLYERVGGSLVLRQSLVPPVGGAGSDFGAALDLDGSRLIVGAPGSGGRGRVFAYELQGSSWVYTGEAGPPNVTSGADLGASVALSGDVLVVGAPGTAGFRGQAWILRTAGGQWDVEASLLAPPGWDDGLMGAEVDIAGSRVAVAAPYADGPAGFRTGRVAAYEFNGVDWALSGELTPVDHHHSDRMGQGGVVVSGDQILVGCPNATGIVGFGYSSPGYVYVFEETPAGWSQVQKLGASDPDTGSWFGGAIDTLGDTLLVGAHRDTRALLLTGAAYLFERQSLPQGTEWVQGETLLSPTPFVGDHLGYRVALTQEYALLGAGLGGEVGYPVQVGSVLSYDRSNLPDLVAEPFCFGSRCPCDRRNSVLGGCKNSSDLAGELRACGTASVTMDDLVLTADGLLPNQLGLLLMGGGPLDQLFGDGRLCVGPGGAGVYRFPVRATGSQGRFEESGLVAHSQASFGSGAILPGSTWYYQVWYRDAASLPCPITFAGGSVSPVPTPKGFSLTSALAVTWRP